MDNYLNRLHRIYGGEANETSTDAHAVRKNGHTRQVIQLSTRTGLVCVEGSGLTITLLTRTRVEIRGKISAVRLG